MSHPRIQLALVALLLAGACDDAPPEQPTTPEPAPAEPSIPSPPPTPTEPPAPAEQPAPEVPEPPEPPSFDPLLAEEAIVRVTAVYREHWHPCGYVHSTGVIEVDVLNVGEPAPHMLLVISCPVDFGHRELLMVGKTMKVGFHARRQRWPVPSALRRLPAELPRRWVKSMVAVDDSAENRG